MDHNQLMNQAAHQTNAQRTQNPTGPDSGEPTHHTSQKNSEEIARFDPALRL
jgi:hypothetical protein